MDNVEESIRRSNYEQLSIFDLFSDEIREAERGVVAQVADVKGVTAPSAEDRKKVGEQEGGVPSLCDAVCIGRASFKGSKKAHSIVISWKKSIGSRGVKWRVCVDGDKTVGYNDLEPLCLDWGLPLEELQTRFGV